MDIGKIRNMFALYGHRDVLPPDNNCISLIPLLRQFLPRGTSAALDLIFPILFPDSELVGQNHRALPDARMVREILLLLIELTKPPEERNLDRYDPES